LTSPCIIIIIVVVVLVVVVVGISDIDRIYLTDIDFMSVSCSKQKAQLLLGDRATRKHAKDS